MAQRFTRPIRDAWEYRNFVGFMALKHLRLRYRGSAIGFFWTLLNPLLTIGVYAFAFLVVVRVSTIDNFRLYLIVAIIHWHYFSLAVSNGINSVVDNAPIMKSVDFPRITLPASTVSAAFVEQLLALVVLIPVFLVMDGALWWGLALYPVVLAMLYLSLAGAVAILAAATAFFRDIRQMVDIMLKMLFWLTPIVFTFDLYPERAQYFLRFSPVTIFVRTITDILIFGVGPTPARWLAMGLCVAVPLAISSLLYARLQGRFAERL